MVGRCFLLGWLPGRCELLVSRRVHLHSWRIFQLVILTFGAIYTPQKGPLSCLENPRKIGPICLDLFLEPGLISATHGRIKYIGGQMEIILHQPGFPWRGPISLAKPPIWGPKKSCELPKRRNLFPKISSKRPRPTAIFPAPTCESSIVATWTFPSHPWIRHAPAPGKFLDVGKGVK